MALIAALIASGEAESGMALPPDFDIFALPSIPGRRPVFGTIACASGRTAAPAAALMRRTISLVCSISGA
jgi:hypothetical protein